MCGRYMITSSFEAMARLFEARRSPSSGPTRARPNVSPTETIPVVVSHEGDRTHRADALGPAAALVHARRTAGRS